MENLNNNLSEVNRSNHNCPSCGGDMPKAVNYGGVPSNIYQFGKCKNCDEELLSIFKYIWDGIQSVGQFFWIKSKHPKFK